MIGSEAFRAAVASYDNMAVNQTARYAAQKFLFVFFLGKTA